MAHLLLRVLIDTWGDPKHFLYSILLRASRAPYTTVSRTYLYGGFAVQHL